MNATFGTAWTGPDTNLNERTRRMREGQAAEEGEEQLTDDQFLRQLRADVEGVREGTIPSIVAAQRQSPKDRPWSKRHKIRNRRGVAY
jgi:hypothetical protein